MLNKVRLRLTVVCAASTGLVLLAMALLSLHFSTTQLTRQYDETFNSNVNTVLYYLRGQRVISHTWLAQTESDNQMIIGVYVEQEPLMYTVQSAERFALIELARTQAGELGYDLTAAPASELQANRIDFDMQTQYASYRVAVCAVPASEHVLSVSVIKSRAVEAAQIRDLRWVFGFWAAVAVACLALFAWLFSRWAVRPAVQAQREQSEFVSAASHELRAPLAVIAASAGAMKDATRDEAAVFARRIEQECERMSRLTGDLLALAGASSQRLALNMAPLETETLVLSVYERFEPLAAEKGLTLRVALPDEALPRAVNDAGRLEQILTVLLSNALDHAQGSIELRACKKRRGVVISVADDGPGVPGGDKARIFERFYRADGARTDKQHFGLGLSVAMELAQLCGCKLAVGDNEPRGAVFTLTIPI